jgi:hypothetical protein
MGYFAYVFCLYFLHFAYVFGWFFREIAYVLRIKWYICS